MMKKINLEGLDKELYQETLMNGLDIYLIPYEDKKNYYISYATKYGSDVLSFITDARRYTPPLGVAHFLEHKMFEEQSGEDPFTFFSKVEVMEMHLPHTIILSIFVEVINALKKI